MSLSPPARPTVAFFDPVLPRPPIVKWLEEQEQFKRLLSGRTGPTALHLHCGGHRHVDIAAISRGIHANIDPEVTIGDARRAERSWIYFEFDANDPRRNNIVSLLTYLINAILWRFWDRQTNIMPAELRFLQNTNAWTLHDLYHLYRCWRHSLTWADNLTIFLGCFDQCDQSQRKWFVERTLMEQGHSDEPYRIVFSTLSQDGLATDTFPDSARINMGDELTLLGVDEQSISSYLRKDLDDLLTRRPVYKNHRQRLESFLDECIKTEVPGVACRVGLRWLERNHRGKPEHHILHAIEKLFPPTPDNLLAVITSSMPPTLQQRAQIIVNWIRHAAEPWPSEALCQALAIHEAPEDEGLRLEDLDAPGTTDSILQAFCGILTIHDGEVRFVDHSFYQTSAADLGVDDGNEAISKIHSSIAAACLRYLLLPDGQETLVSLFEQNIEGGPWTTPLEAVVICRSQSSLAEYAAQFWPQHYKASGRFKPSGLARRLFSDKKARAAWENASWILSNPFTRIQRGYISLLPTIAGVGLVDLVDELLEHEKEDPQFDLNCWHAITEAARAGSLTMVQRFLQQVKTTDQSELALALHWSASHGDASIVNALLARIPKLETFPWPPQIMYRAAAAGLDDLLAAMILAGRDIDELGDYWTAPPTLVAIWRDRVSTVEFLLNSKPQPNMKLRDEDGDSLLETALRVGNPSTVKLIVEADPESATAVHENQLGAAQTAVNESRHQALKIVLDAGAPLQVDVNDLLSTRVPLVAATDAGYRECVRVLLAHGVDPNIESNIGTALYKAVEKDDIEISKMLLAHDPKPDMDLTPPGRSRLLVNAINNDNIELVSLLLEAGAKTDFVDAASWFTKTPLAIACKRGKLEMVKLLQAHGADINYTGGESDSPLYSALFAGSLDVARYLLDDEKTDVFWTASDGVNSLIAADRFPDILAELLKRGLDINSSGVLGTVLHSCARSSGKVESIKILLAHDPKAEIECIFPSNGVPPEEKGFTPLQAACYYGKHEAAEVLLEAGADPCFRNEYGEDALDIALRRDQVDGVQECLKLLLRKQHNVPIDRVDDQGHTRLHTAIRNDTNVTTIQLMLDAGASLDSHDKEEYTPLALAVKVENTALVKHLIEKGANVNVFGPSFGSILHLAVGKGNLELAKLLVGSGADVEAVHQDFGESILYTALGIEDQSSRREMVRYLVKEANAPVNKASNSEFRYPIIRAASRLQLHQEGVIATRLIKFLIKNKADVNVADTQGRRAVHFATQGFRAVPLKVLVKAGAAIDVSDNLGRKPLHFAAGNTYIDDEIFYYLLQELGDKVDIDVRDQDGWTPLLWAARARNQGERVKTLVSRGADVWIRGRGYLGKEWSALKLHNAAFPSEPYIGELLEPKDRKRKIASGEVEEWDDKFHAPEDGKLLFDRSARCNSCLDVSLHIFPSAMPRPPTNLSHSRLANHSGVLVDQRHRVEMSRLSRRQARFALLQVHRPSDRDTQPRSHI